MLGIAVYNHASTFSSIHWRVQATQTAINMHEIIDCVYSMCVCESVWELIALQATSTTEHFPLCADLNLSFILSFPTPDHQSVNVVQYFERFSS